MFDYVSDRYAAGAEDAVTEWPETYLSDTGDIAVIDTRTRRSSPVPGTAMSTLRSTSKIRNARTGEPIVEATATTSSSCPTPCWPSSSPTPDWNSPMPAGSRPVALPPPGRALHGLGVSTTRAFAAGDVIERCSVVVVPAAEHPLLDETNLLQPLPLPCARYLKIFDADTVEFAAVRAIDSGHEITVDSTDHGSNPLWFPLQPSP